MRVSSKKKEFVSTNGIPTIWVEELLDASGSMGYQSWKGPTKYTVAEEGINQKIESLKKANNVNYMFGVSEFDEYNGAMRINESVKAVPITDVSKFKGRGAYGNTPLYEAVAITINRILSQKKPEDRVLLSVYTDGEENRSAGIWNRYNGGAKKLEILMDEVRKNNNFTITFIGTKEDVESMIVETGMARGNTHSYDGTAKGMKMSMLRNVGSTMAFAEDVKERGITTTDNFYTKTVDEDAEAKK